MSDRASSLEKLVEVETDIRELEASGIRLYGADEVVSETLREFKRPFEVVVVAENKNARTPSVFFDDDLVNITVLGPNYGDLADNAGLPRADIVVLEISARVNQDDLSRWNVARSLSGSDMLFLQTGAEILDPFSFDKIVAANKADCHRVFGEDLQYFTATPKLAEAVFAREEREKLALLERGAILLEKRVAVGQKNQRNSLTFLEEMLQARQHYDSTLTDLGFIQGGQVEWDRILRTQTERGLSEENRALYKKISQKFKTHNGGQLYRSLVDHLRNRKKATPRNRKKVEQLERDLLHVLILSAQQVMKEIIVDYVSAVNDRFFTAIESVLSMISISTDSFIDAARLEIEGEEIDTEMSDLGFQIDIKQALTPTFQIVKTLLMDGASGAVLGGVAAGSLSGEPSTTIVVAILAALAKMGYAFYGLYETERVSLERIVENNMIPGLLKDAETLLRDEVDIYVATFRQQVRAAVEEAITLIASELADQLAFYNRMLNSTEAELRLEIEHVKASIGELDALIENIRLIPAASGSEAEAAVA